MRCALVSLLFSLAACGTIEFLDGGTSPTVTPDSDGGIAGLNTDGGDNGEGPPPDAGPGCRQRPTPPLPNAWPYKQTQASYELHFGSGLPDRAVCSTAACHGGNPGPTSPPLSTPLIPAANATLDANALTNAIQGLWARVLPTMDQIPPPTDPTPPLIWHHAPPPDGSNQAPPYSVEQLAYVKKFIEMARDCGWLATQMQERGQPPQNCINGVCDCPITLDLSYCNQ